MSGRSDSKKPRRIAFHIGLELTGSTSIQRNCLRNRKQFSKQSALYPTHNLAFGDINHIGLVAGYLPPNPGDYFLPRRNIERRQVLDSLFHEIRTSGAQTIILSAEHFSSRFRRSQILELAADFAGFDCKIVVFLRDHLSRFYSAYATHVASGGDLTIEQYADVVLHRECMEYRYADTIALWAEAFGATNVELKPYDPRQDSTLEFVKACGLMPGAAHALTHIKPGWIDITNRRNSSLGPRRTEILRLVNARLSSLSWPANRIGQECRHYAWVAVRSVLHLAGQFDRLIGLQGGQPWSLDPARLDRLLSNARNDAVKLREQFGFSFTSSASE